MASTLVTSIASQEDTVPNGIKRSRLSVHLNTPRRRRWLLVQLVSLPNDLQDEKRESQHIDHLEPKAPPYDYNRLMSEFETSRLVRRIV